MGWNECYYFVIFIRLTITSHFSLGFFIIPIPHDWKLGKGAMCELIIVQQLLAGHWMDLFCHVKYKHDNNALLTNAKVKSGNHISHLIFYFFLYFLILHFFHLWLYCIQTVIMTAKHCTLLWSQLSNVVSFFCLLLSTAILDHVLLPFKWNHVICYFVKF